ncbi:MAG TPA: hypothetical protein VJ875_14200 [Pyrinomonadaceae bacterium]|nr:hypothetical protein [Pyrinomonadaceae bacterium]
MKVLIVTKLLVSFLITCGAVELVSAQSSISSRVNVRLVTDETEGVLSILAKKKSNGPVTDADWQRLFHSEGYTRLKQRETSIQRPFEASPQRSTESTSG